MIIKTTLKEFFIEKKVNQNEVLELGNTEDNVSVFTSQEEINSEGENPKEYDIEDLVINLDEESELKIEDGKLVVEDEDSNEAVLAELLNKVIEVDEVKADIDVNNDGEVSDEEVSTFIDDIKGYDENPNNFSLVDLLVKLKQIQERLLQSINSTQTQTDTSSPNFAGITSNTSNSNPVSTTSAGSRPSTSYSNPVNTSSASTSSASTPSNYGTSNVQAQSSVSSVDKSNIVTIKKGDDFNIELSEYQQNELEAFKSNYEQNKDKYETVAAATNIPAELVAAIHWRESSGNFNTYLHNGQELGKETTITPKGIYFEDWTEAAIHAISTHNPEIVKDGDIESCYEFAERYNGLGYRNKGMSSPYVWAGTDNYSCGKYVADGKFDPNVKDQQLGVAVMIDALIS